MSHSDLFFTEMNAVVFRNLALHVVSTVGQYIPRYLDDSAEKEAKAREQLEIMMKLAEARLDNFQTELEMMFVNPEWFHFAFARSSPGTVGRKAATQGSRIPACWSVPRA
ncbi:hypothetical protein BDW22DRAFT_1342007 [Trametopsis cervina]|nr:hypothetical protein BDW22DRAFT_1342007 [Trametopsis cervina]